MANPMQKRSKNAFLLGVIITLVLTLLISGILMSRINNLNKKIKSMEKKQIKVYVAKEDIKSGDILTQDMLKKQSVITTVKGDEIISEIAEELPVSLFKPDSEKENENQEDEEENQEGEEQEEENKESEKQEEEEVTVKYIAKIDIPAGSIITNSMVTIEEERATKDQRMQEYNMISLPSRLKKEAYIDIRFRLPSGEDYVVLSKKKVERATASSIWLKVNEAEILTMNNVIIENWIMTGSKLYAIEYTEPGLQEEAISTYPISEKIIEYIDANPNVLAEAINDLNNRYTDKLYSQRTDKINPILNQYGDEKDSLVEKGTTAEIKSIQEARNSYIESLK